MAYTYSLGAVKPHVKSAAYVLGPKYQIKTVYGWGLRANASDHPKGLALDFMVSDITRGTALADDAIRNAGQFGIKYVIWRQRIWNIGSSGWKKMGDRGGTTANHFDHVHVSFNATPGSGGIVQVGNPISAATQTLRDLETLAKWLANSHNWERIGWMAVGIALIIFGLLRFDNVKAVTNEAVKVVKK